MLILCLLSIRGNKDKGDQCFHKCFQVYTAVENPEVHMCPKDRGVGFKGEASSGEAILIYLKTL